MEIKVGEYVRTKDGVIAKVTYVDAMMVDCDRDVYDLEHLAMMEIPIEDKEEYILKHSKNIIDLVEVGDYINGHKVVSEQWGEDDNNLYFEIEGGFNKARYIGEKEIKTILTHEQYERNCYKLEE